LKGRGADPVSILTVAATRFVSVCLCLCKLRPVALQDVQAFRSVTDQCLAFPCLPEGLRADPTGIEGANSAGVAGVMLSPACLKRKSQPSSAPP